MLKHRRSGILLHPTSLPGPQPVGSLGQEAYEFIDFLVSAGQSVWQILPLGPTGFGNCPYSSFSAFAGNPLLIDLRSLAASGDLDSEQLPPAGQMSGQADFSTAFEIQRPLLKKACNRFKEAASDERKEAASDERKEAASDERKEAFSQFCHQQDWWLDDYALFEAIRREQGNNDWQNWPQPLRQREAAAMQQETEHLAEFIFEQKYLQFVFFEQWFAVKDYANRNGIQIYGDLPIFVAENSADVWAHKEQYLLDGDDRPTFVAGVPPDYFSATGQRWGNPLYNWEHMENNNFSWWVKRFRWNFTLFDLIRVDHFRGFASCWAIPANEPTAQNGSWVESPGKQLFLQLEKELGELPIVAEDLGVITPEVEELRDHFGFPGMKILQFAFDSDALNPYLPHNHIPNSVIYTGTHDNNTTLGWWQELDSNMQERIAFYLVQQQAEMPWLLVQTALASVAKLTVIPLQDILGLPGSSRMNTPGTAEHNWQWRYRTEELGVEIGKKLKYHSQIYGRNLCFPTEM